MSYSAPYPYRLGGHEPLLATVRMVGNSLATQQAIASASRTAADGAGRVPAFAYVTTAPSGTVFTYRAANGAALYAVAGLAFATLATAVVGAQVFYETGATDGGGQSIWSTSVVVGTPGEVREKGGLVLPATASATPYAPGDLPPVAPSTSLVPSLASTASDGTPWFAATAGGTRLALFEGGAPLAPLGSYPGGTGALVAQLAPGGAWVFINL